MPPLTSPKAFSDKESDESAQTRQPRTALYTILVAGLIAGCLDLAFALIWFGLHGKPPEQLLKSIAGGALGMKAFDGGIGMAALGVFFHFCISTGAAATYYVASRYISAVNSYAWVSGIIFGLLVYEFMHLVVLPLSAYHRPVAFPPLFVPDVLSHLFFVGCAISLIVRRFQPTTPPA